MGEMIRRYFMLYIVGIAHRNSVFSRRKVFTLVKCGEKNGACLTTRTVFFSVGMRTNITGEFLGIACRLPAFKNFSLAHNNVNSSQAPSPKEEPVNHTSPQSGQHSNASAAAGQGVLLG
ncbi:hypothetical protein SUGI_0761560 [Cryptomeria japonica]|nr:hypothetical protein SUGI_0761560 [Cryptomeria japonica]